MIQRRVEDLTGTFDPYLTIRRSTNEFALSLLPVFREKLRAAPCPVTLALRLAAAGNIIDLGAKRNLTMDEAKEAVDNAVSLPLAGSDEVDAVGRLLAARRVLLIADNAGEIAFDRLLCEQLPHRPTVAVRSRPVINDATTDDAHQVGIDAFADLITTGSDLPGAWLPSCSPEFVRVFREAELVVSKGQGNYECLSGHRFGGYFLLRVKCPVVAEDCGLPVGSNALIDAWRER
jgi:uncharacterized protein with ATP-grasp and redox domains